MRKIVMTMSVAALLVACSPESVLEGGDDKATREAESTARIETAIFAGTQVGTVVALQATVDGAPVLATQLAQLEQQNAELLATIDAVTTLGVSVQPRFTTTPTPAAISTLNNGGSYDDARTASGIDEATGCAVDEKARFPLDAPIIYLTTVGRGIQVGDVHQVRWLMNEQVQDESVEWVADQDYPEICIYFWLEPSDVSFEVGQWSADLYVNDQRVAAVPFEICTADQTC